MRDDRPWDDSVDNHPDAQLVTIAHACFDFARGGDTERLRGYVEHGVPVNLTDGAGNTLLMLAANHGHPETVSALVDLGGDPDRTNDRGQSPLAGAIFKGEDDVVAALLAADADPDVGTPSARATAEMFDRGELLPVLP
ncbi:MAG TPA: ankyrin repeat domain-containing protein [Dermatophilaceae bacterium]|nr:ankyrin repeat domain-containing protein [Dermatophilaceae bacterium]